MTSQTLVQLASKLMQEYVPLPEQKIGGRAIVNEVKPAGSKLTIVSLRETIFTGLPATNIVIGRPYTVQHLKSDDDGTWMTNNPCELVQMHNEFAKGAEGRVLIGGLGLGVVANMCQKKKAVTHTLVVENDASIVALNASRKLSIHTGGLVDVLKQVQPEEFDQLYIDIYQSTGEWSWQSVVVPLRRLAFGNFRRIAAWQENVMHGQVRQGLMRAVELPAEEIKSKAHCHWYAFRKAAVKIGLRPEKADPIPVDVEGGHHFLQKMIANENDVTLRLLVNLFLNNIGSPNWENLFGEYWDEAWDNEHTSAVEPGEIPDTEDTLGAKESEKDQGVTTSQAED